jgi:hypothetical protein
MGLVTGDQRGALLELAALAAKRTSFGRQLAQQATIYDRARAQQSRLDDLSAAVAPAAPGSSAATSQTLTEVKIVAKLPPGQGFKPAGYYHHLAIDFSLGPQGDNVPSPAFATDAEKEERDAWGTSWEKDLTDPRKNTIYMVRCTLTQLRVEPLLGGFILKWQRPSFAWKWMDGQTARTPVQVVSNPLIVTRLVLSPSTAITRGGFIVNVVAQYP